MVKRAEALEADDWERLERRPRYTSPTGKTRSRREDVKARIVLERGYVNKRLNYEDVAEYDYRPRRRQVLNPAQGHHRDAFRVGDLDPVGFHVVAAGGVLVARGRGQRETAKDECRQSQENNGSVAVFFLGHLDLFAHPAISAATEYERGCELVRMFG